MQDSKFETGGLMISRGIWKDQPFEEDVGNIGFGPFQQGEPGLSRLSPCADAQSPPWAEQRAWAGSRCRLAVHFAASLLTSLGCNFVLWEKSKGLILRCSGAKHTDTCSLF